MEHEEFLAASADKGRVWGVSGIAKTVRAAWGRSGFVFYSVASLLALLPLIAFAAWAIAQGRFGLLGWAIPGTLAFLAGRPGLNLADGMPWIVCLIAGAVIAVWFGGAHLVGGFVVVISWALGGALRGTTMAMLGERLRTSKDAYERVRASGNLFFR